MRAQTTLDFLIGASIFLLTVGLVIGMVPGILDPFALEKSSAPVGANRAATTLATDELATVDSPYVLSEPTVGEFFALNESGVRERLGMDADISVNVTLENDSTRLEATGPPLPEDRSITSAWRVVSYDGEQATLRVRTW